MIRNKNLMEEKIQLIEREESFIMESCYYTHPYMELEDMFKEEKKEISRTESIKTYFFRDINGRETRLFTMEELTDFMRENKIENLLEELK